MSLSEPTSSTVAIDRVGVDGYPWHDKGFYVREICYTLYCIYRCLYHWMLRIIKITTKRIAIIYKVGVIEPISFDNGKNINS